MSAICSQRTVVLVYLFYMQRLLSLLLVLFTKDYVLISCYSFAKDCCPCLLLLICKGLLSLSFAIDLQRTAVLVFLLFISNGLLSLSSAIYLQRTAVLVFCYSCAKDAVLVLCYPFAKDCNPCLVPLVCKQTAVLIFRFRPSKLRWTVVLAMHGELLFSQGSWKRLFPKLALETAVSIVSISL